MQTEHEAPADLLSLLQKLIALTFCWPIEGVDPIEDVEYVREGSRYHPDSQRLAEKYVNNVSKLWNREKSLGAGNLSVLYNYLKT